MAVVDKIESYTIVRQCEKNMNFTTNFSLDPDLESYRMGGKPTPSDPLARAENIRNSYRVIKGKPSLEWLKNLMKSHEGEGRLCRHGTPETGEGYTRLSCLCFPIQRRFEITNGLPCINKYQTFNIHNNWKQKREKEKFL